MNTKVNQELASARNTVKQLKAANNYHKARIDELEKEVAAHKLDAKRAVFILIAFFLFDFWSNVYNLMG